MSDADDPSATEPEDTEPEDTEPEDGQPEDTEPEDTEPEPVMAEPEEGPFATKPSRAPRRRRAARRAVRVVAAAAALVVVVVSAMGYGLVARYTDSVQRSDVFGSIDPTTRPATGPGTTLLLVGVDSRAGFTNAEKRRLRLGTGSYGPPKPDLLMLVHVSPGEGGITAVSMPGDSYVDVPSYTNRKGVVQEQRKNLLSSAYTAGGAPLLVRTVEGATGMRVDHYLEIDFPGFLEMVDAMGGVPVCATKRMVDRKSGLTLPAGTTEVSGPQALAYVRAKAVDSEYGRMSRHQRFLSSAVQKAISAGTLLNPMALNALLQSASTSIKTDASLDRDGLLALGDRLRLISPGDILFFTVPIQKSGYRVDIGKLKNQPTSLWSEDAKNLFARLQQDKPLTSQDADPETTISVRVSPTQVRVRVYNSAGVTGLARRAADDLAAAGYQVVGNPQNAKATGVASTVIEYDPDFDESLKTLRAAFPSAQVKESPGIGNVFRIYVGSDYSGVRPVTVSATATGPVATIASPTKPRTAADPICG